MRTLIVVFFALLHDLYAMVYKEIEYSRFFAASIIAVIIVIELAVLISYLLFYFNPLWAFAFYTYYKFVAVGIVLLSWWYISPQEKADKLLYFYSKVDKPNRMISVILLFVKLCVVFYLFFLMGDKLRELDIISEKNN